MIDLEHMIEQVVRRVLAEERTVPPPDLVTVAEYARVRSISEKTVRVAIAEHRLDVLRIGRAVRIPANAEIARRRGVGNARALTVLMGGGGKR